MSKNTIIGLSVVAVVVVAAIFLWTWTMGVYKGEIERANGYDAQFNAVETTLDNMRMVSILLVCGTVAAHHNQLDRRATCQK